MGEENMKEPEGTGFGASENMRRNMEFIVQQQAQFAADMQRLSEAQTRSDEKWARTEESIRSLLAIAQLHDQEIGTLDESDTRLEDALRRLADAQARSEDALARLPQFQSQIEEALARLPQFQSRIEEVLARLSESQAQTDRQMAETDRRMAETDRRMAETDERINALVNTVERIISERRNGLQG